MQWATQVANEVVVVALFEDARRRVNRWKEGPVERKDGWLGNGRNEKL